MEQQQPLDCQSIFVRAIEIDAPADRQAYLTEACQNDSALTDKVRALLKAYEEAGSFLEHPRGDDALTLDLPTRDRPGAMVGPYKLLQEIGEGGMGCVYLAEQTHPVQRKVALKVIRAGMDGKQILARFEAERQALAMMDHPNIAKVLDAGTSASGQPYFAMELVKGVPITRYCDERHLTPRQRLELFIPVCEAVQHAHQKGVIHRDLKPTNVLVAQYDGRPVPKVIDFGVAKATGSKLTDCTLFTDFGAVVGTLEYMSPEQAEMNQLDTDTRSDIYSLGVLLYELLTGTTPLERQKLKNAAMSEVLRRIREEEPPTPSTRLSTTQELPAIATKRGLEPRKLSGMVHGELDWIVMKALEKDRIRRYDTATGLAADVRRYLDDEPVLARPMSTIYRAKKFIRKHRFGVGAASAIVLALVLGLGAAAFGLVRATNARKVADQRALTEADAKRAAQRARDGEAQQRKQTEIALASAQTNAYSTQIKLANEYLQRNVIAQTEKSLNDCPPALRNWEWNYLHRLCHIDLMTLTGHIEPVTDVRYSLDGKRLMSFTFYGFSEVRVWDAVTGREVRQLSDWHSENLSTADISPNGQIIATGSTIGSVNLWNVSDGAQRQHFKFFTGKITSLSFSPDGQFLAASGQNSPGNVQVMKVWRVAGGDPVFEQLGTSGFVSFSPDGKWLLTSTPSILPQMLAPSGVEMKLWDTTTWKQARTLGYHSAVTFSGDGRRIAVTTRDRSSDSWTISILNATTGQETLAIKSPGGVGDVSLDARGDHVAATGGWGAPIIRVWDARSGKQTATLRGHTDTVSAIAYSPDGSRLASACWDHTVKVWDPRSSGEVTELPGGAVEFSSNVAMDANGTVVAYSQANAVSLLTGRIKEITLLDMRAGRVTRSLRGHEQPAKTMAISSDGSILVSGSEDRTARSWDTASGKELFVFHGHAGPVTAVAVSSDGQWAASSDEDPTLVEIDRARVMKANTAELVPIVVRVWNTHTGQERCHFAAQTGNINVLCFSPNGTHLVSAALNDVRLWDSATGRQLHSCQGAGGSILSVAFTSDGQKFAASSYGNSENEDAIRIWDSRSGQLRQTLRGHGRNIVRCMAFSPDGSRLASAAGAELKLWDANSGTDLLSLPGATDSISAIQFDPESRRIIAALQSGSILIWDASNATEGGGRRTMLHRPASSATTEVVQWNNIDPTRCCPAESVIRR